MTMYSICKMSWKCSVCKGHLMFPHYTIVLEGFLWNNTQCYTVTISCVPYIKTRKVMISIWKHIPKNGTHHFCFISVSFLFHFHQLNKYSTWLFFAPSFLSFIIIEWSWRTVCVDAERGCSSEPAALSFVNLHFALTHTRCNTTLIAFMGNSPRRVYIAFAHTPLCIWNCQLVSPLLH